MVVYDRGVSAAEGAAVEAAGATIVSENKAIGVATVRSGHRGFAAATARQHALEGAAPNEAIGYAPLVQPARWEDIEKVTGRKAKALKTRAVKAQKAEPLAGLGSGTWRRSVATATASNKVQQGSHAVRVGVIDTGVDASYPDIGGASTGG